MWTVSVPTSVPISNKRRFSLNLNTYRNAHHHTLNRAKKEFERIALERIRELPKMEGVHLTYTLFTGTAQLSDTSNVCCIVDKFFADTLVNGGKLEDDNYNVVLSTHFQYGGLDRSDPRVEVTVEPVGKISYETDEKEEDMQITITQPEIEEAIRNYVMGQVTVSEDREIDIVLKATRGDAGYTAEIDIRPATPKAPTPAPTKPKSQAKTADLGIGKAIAEAKQGKDTPAATAKEDTPVESEDKAADEAPATEAKVLQFAAESKADTKSDSEEAAPAPKRSIFGGLASKPE